MGEDELFADDLRLMLIPVRQFIDRAARLPQFIAQLRHASLRRGNRASRFCKARFQFLGRGASGFPHFRRQFAQFGGRGGKIGLGHGKFSRKRRDVCANGDSNVGSHDLSLKADEPL